MPFASPDRAFAGSETGLVVLERSGKPGLFCFATQNIGQGVVLNRKGYSLQVLVRDNNVDQALRVLKKKMQREGLFREMKARSAYEKPSEKRVREKAEAVRRFRKLARKKLQREGLLPAPKKVVRPR